MNPPPVPDRGYRARPVLRLAGAGWKPGSIGGGWTCWLGRGPPPGACIGSDIDQGGLHDYAKTGLQGAAELPEDEHGPHEVYDEVIVLPADYADTALEAHDKILRELRTEGYIELPRVNGVGAIPFNAWSVREVVVWEG